MALTLIQLANAIRANATDTESTAIITRIQAYCNTAIHAYAPNAPESVSDEALVRMAGYLYDSPSTSYANALTNSGAAAILLPYRDIRGGAVTNDEGGTAATSGSVPSGGGGGLTPEQSAEITALRAELNTAKGNIINLQNSLTSTIGRVSTAETDISTAETDIESLEDKEIPAGGTANQVLAKRTNDDYDTQWANPQSTNAAVDDLNAAVTNINSYLSVVTSRISKLHHSDLTGWVDQVQPNSGEVEFGVTFISGSSVPTLAQVQRSQVNYRASISNPNAIGDWPQGSLVFRLLAADVDDELENVRLRLRTNNYGNEYIDAPLFELIENSTGTGQNLWRYYSVLYSESRNYRIPAYIAGVTVQRHDENETDYLGLVGGVDAGNIPGRLLPSGGADDQILAKKSGDNYDVEWIDQPSGGGSGGVTVTQLNQSNPTIETGTTNTANAQATFNSADAGRIWAAIQAGSHIYLDTNGTGVYIGGWNANNRSQIQNVICIVLTTIRIIQVRVESASNVTLRLYSVNSSLGRSSLTAWRNSQTIRIYGIS